MEEVQIPYIPADHSVLHHQHGSVCKEFPDGIRPDHGYDKGRSGAEHRVYFIPDIQQRSFRRKLRISERERGCILHCNRGDLCSADDYIK